jgi:hypothetical protein
MCGLAAHRFSPNAVELPRHPLRSGAVTGRCSCEYVGGDADRRPVVLREDGREARRTRDTPEQVRQISDGDRIVIRNPRPRVVGSVLMIGPTHGGWIVAVVLIPEPADAGAWHVRTAWDASTAQISRYYRTARSLS